MATYRKDIEGLRAIAVTSILLFHFGYGALGGGYIGVDVFFVISGYLIGRSVLGQVADGSFSLVDFYARRIRRLYPALVAMLAVSAAAGWWLLFPLDLAAFGKSMVATAGYASNILFLRETGYFDQSAILKPLLHTWSLAVEEQFYIALPLILLPLARVGVRRRGMIAVVGALEAASFAAAAWAMPNYPGAAFYLFPLRAWELLAGVLVGSADWRWLAARRGPRETVAGSGLAMIVLAILLYAPETRFPGVAALPPVLGAALVIAAGSGGGTRAGALLGLKPFGEIGRISYSLYLWHWPLVVGLAYAHGGAPLPQVWRVAGIAATIVLAIASYRLIEQPFRGRRGGNIGLFAAAAAASLLIAGVGLVFYKTGGLPGRYAPADRLLAAAASDFQQRRGTCVEADNPVMPGIAFCRIGAADAAPDFLVWADSHGRAFRDGLDLAASEHARAGLLVWAGGCPPLIGLAKQESANTPAEDARCLAQNRRLAAWLAQDGTLRDVLLIGRWAYYTEGRGTGSDAANSMHLIGAAPAPQLFAEALARTARTLAAQGRRVFVLEQVPEVPRFSALTLAQRVLVRRQSLPAVLGEIGVVGRNAVEHRQAQAEHALAAVAADGAATIVRTHPALCDAMLCRAWGQGQPLLFDNNHVTVRASLALRRMFDPVFAERAGDHAPRPSRIRTRS